MGLQSFVRENDDLKLISIWLRGIANLVVRENDDLKLICYRGIAKFCVRERRPQANFYLVTWDC